MAAFRRESTTASAMTVVVLICVVASSCSWVSEAFVLNDDSRGARTVPLYVQKARQYLQRQKAYERTMQARMKILSRAVEAFSGKLYLQHVRHNHHGNILLSPLSAYVSLAMALTATRGHTKREILAAMALAGPKASRAGGKKRRAGIHTSLQRALKSLLEDDTGDDVNSDLSGEMPQSDEPAMLDLSYQDLENIIRNDYLMDSSISYNTGGHQPTHIKYGTAVKAAGSQAQADDASVVNSDHDSGSSLKDQQAESDLFVRIANGMFHSEEVALSQHFSNRLVSLYGAPPMAMQQGQPEMSVNLWVDAVTRGVIPDMLTADNVNNRTLLVLVNALSFWGSWENNFDKKEVVPLDFRTQDRGGATVSVQSMYRVGNYSVKNVKELGAKVLELPYSNTRYSLFVLLPSPSTGLHGLERGLKTHKLQTLLHDMPEPATTVVILPKFHLRSRISLGSELKRQGVQKLFKKRKADLRRMTGEDKSRLYVNDLFQYAALEVNDGAKSDPGKNSITIGSGWDMPSPLDSDSASSNASSYSHFNDSDSDRGDDNNGEENPNSDIENDYEDDYYDYDSSDYEDYEDYGGLGSSSQYFIADKPFFFVVKDKQYDLNLLMGRVTRPLP